jgi:hypothetical protein
MSAPQLLQTAGLLGLFVLLAGGYGLLYGLGRLRERRGLVLAGFASYALQCVVAVAVLLDAPIGGWKAFVALSCAIYLFIPPVTWRCLAALHAHEGCET